MFSEKWIIWTDEWARHWSDEKFYLNLNVYELQNTQIQSGKWIRHKANKGLVPRKFSLYYISLARLKPILMCLQKKGKNILILLSKKPKVSLK